MAGLDVLRTVQLADGVASAKALHSEATLAKWWMEVPGGMEVPNCRRRYSWEGR